MHQNKAKASTARDHAADRIIARIIKSIRAITFVLNLTSVALLYLVLRALGIESLTVHFIGGALSIWMATNLNDRISTKLFYAWLSRSLKRAGITVEQSADGSTITINGEAKK